LTEAGQWILISLTSSRAAAEFRKRVLTRSGDQVLVMSFSDKPCVVQDFTNDPDGRFH